MSMFNFNNIRIHNSSNRNWPIRGRPSLNADHRRSTGPTRLLIFIFNFFGHEIPAIGRVNYIIKMKEIYWLPQLIRSVSVVKGQMSDNSLCCLRVCARLLTMLFKFFLFFLLLTSITTMLLIPQNTPSL